MGSKPVALGVRFAKAIRAVDSSVAYSVQGSEVHLGFIARQVAIYIGWSVNKVPSGIVFALFETGTGQRLFPWRMPSFFASFPVVLLDDLGVVRADQPFRRAEPKYALERL